MSQTGNNQESDIPIEFLEQVAEEKARREAWFVAQQEEAITRQQERDKINRMGCWAAEMLRKAQVPYDAVRTQTTLTQGFILFWKGPLYRGKRGKRGWQLFQPRSMADNDSRDVIDYDVILEPDGAIVHRINGQEWHEQTTPMRVYSHWRYRNDQIEKALIDLLSEKT